VISKNTVSYRNLTLWGFFEKRNKREEERVPLTLEIGELGGFGMEFEGCHHLIVAANVLESLEFVIGEFLRRH